MSVLIPYLQSILYVLLGTSAATLLAFVLATFIRSGPRSATLTSLAKLIATVTSLGTLMISLLNVSTPIGAAPIKDEAKQTIERFYDAIQDRNYDTAYGLIHSARKEEIRRDLPNFDRDRFSETYATVREYKNRLITSLSPGNEVMGRTYMVSFDVSEEVPWNRLFGYRQATVNDLGANNLLNIEPLIAFAIQNLKEFYEVPATAEPLIREFILSRQLESILDPLFLSEIRRNLVLEHQIDLKPRSIKPSPKIVRRHFIQELLLVREDGTWKIRQGLAHPQAVSVYLSSAAP